MISEKLLETVCPNTERYTYRIVSGNVEVIDHKWSGIIGTMNIHEVAHKCKEWLISKEAFPTIRYQLLFINYEDVLQVTCILNETNADGYYNYEEDFEGDTELDVILLACEYVLNKGEEDGL